MTAAQVISLLSTLVVIVGAIGVGAAIVACFRVAREKGAWGIFEKAFSRNLDWRAQENEPLTWLKGRGIAEDTHIGQHFITAWHAWNAGTHVTPAELHHLSVRRERTRFSARLSGGVAAVLLICGIAGTLTAIKPILGGFQITAGADGTVERSDSEKNMVALVHGLGDAFHPSLWALGLTLVVAFFRGIYVHKANALSRGLDAYAITTLLPAFPPKLIGAQLANVVTELGKLLALANQRDASFGTAVNALEKVAASLSTADADLKAAAAKAEEASKKMADDAATVLGRLEIYLGEKSPLVAAIHKFGAATSEVTKTRGDLQAAARSLEDSGRRAATSAENAAKALEASVVQIPEQITAGCQQATAETERAVDGIKKELEHGLDAQRAAMAHELKSGIERQSATVAAEIKSGLEQMRGAAVTSVDAAAAESVGKFKAIANNLANSSLAVESGTQEMRHAGRTLHGELHEILRTSREDLVNGAADSVAHIQTARDEIAHAVNAVIDAIQRIPPPMPPPLPRKRGWVTRLWRWFF